MCNIMGLPCEEMNADMNKMHASSLMVRNASSLSTESSEFEFGFQDESPSSPKLLLSPKYPIYTLNHLPDGENALKASPNQYSAEENYIPNHFPDGESNFLQAFCNYQHYVERHQYTIYEEIKVTVFDSADSGQNGLFLSISGGDSGSADDNSEIKGTFSDNQQALRDKSDQISVINHTNENYSEASPSVLTANYHDSNGSREGNSLRSLLNRRDLEQLPPLTNYNDFEDKKNSFSASATSSLSNHYANPPHLCNCEDHCPDSAEASTSPPDSTKSNKKKSRKWAFNLDFLKKSPSPRVDQALNRRSSSDNHSDDSVNYGVKHDPLNQFSVSAAADVEAGVENHLEERDFHNGAATAGAAEAGKQRASHYRAAGAASEARFNQLFNFGISANHPAACDYPQKERRLTQKLVNHTIDHYRASAAAEIKKYESPRRSTSSVISSVDSLPRHADNEMIRANQKMISKSVPMSPSAGSPPRSSGAGEQDAFTRRRRPMSPHALHYQQNKAREDELRRRTFLPYRQSLLGACFFPISTNPHNPQQAVY